jgi:hypothetical protein
VPFHHSHYTKLPTGASSRFSTEIPVKMWIFCSIFSLHICRPSRGAAAAKKTGAKPQLLVGLQVVIRTG